MEVRRSIQKRSLTWQFYSLVSLHRVRCDICCLELAYLRGSTTNLLRHVKSKHPTEYQTEERSKGIKKCSCSKKERKLIKKRSSIWKYFTLISIDRVSCNICSNELSYLHGSTTNLLRHVKKIHPTVDPDDEDYSCEMEDAHLLTPKKSGKLRNIRAGLRSAATKRPPCTKSTCEEEDKKPPKMMMSDGDEKPPKKREKAEINYYKFQRSKHTTLVLESLAHDESFMDVTLMSEGKAIKAHKSVLSAMSPYFRRVLSQNTCQHPIIVMPKNVSFEELRNLVTYIYRGEVSVSSRDVVSLLQTAHTLEVAGLRQLLLASDEIALRGASGDASVTVEERPVAVRMDHADEVDVKEEPIEDEDTASADDSLAIGTNPGDWEPAEAPPQIKVESKPICFAKGSLRPPIRVAMETSSSTLVTIETSPTLEERSGSGVDVSDLGLPPTDLSKTDSDVIRWFICDCGTIFLEQAALDDHRKGSCTSDSKPKT